MFHIATIIFMLITFETAQLLFKIFVVSTIAAFVLYLPRIWYFVDGFKKVKQLNNPVKNRLAVLVPARNEKGVIHMMESLEKQTYSHKFFDTFIIVKDSNDPAIELCKNYTNMFSIVVPVQSCKGDALDGALQKIMKKKKKYAGYIIVDADNVVDENFVLEMNNSLVSDADIILGKRCVKNYLYSKEYRNWVVNCNGLIYTFLDKLGNAFRSKHNMYCSVCGTGIMITSRLVDEIGGWPYRSVTEDYELGITSLIAGRKFFLYEPAVTYTEESLSHKNANDRRRRWLLGFAQVTAKYKKDVIAKYHEDKEKLKNGLSGEELKKVRGNFWGCFDFLYSLIPLAFIFAPAAIAAIVFGAATVNSWLKFGIYDSSTIFFVKRFGVCCLYLYGILFVYTLIGMIADRKVLKISFLEKLLVLLINPFYIAEYVKFFFWAFYKLATKSEDLEWVPIERIEDKIPAKKRLRK